MMCYLLKRLIICEWGSERGMTVFAGQACKISVLAGVTKKNPATRPGLNPRSMRRSAEHALEYTLHNLPTPVTSSMLI